MASATLPYYEFNAGYLDGLSAHDPDVEGHFVGYFSRLMQMKLRRHSVNIDQLDDVRQETFARVLKAVRTKGRIRRPECLGAFVSTVCDNVLHESFRSARHYQPMEDMLAEPQDQARSPEAIITGLETARAVHLALCRLPLRERTALSGVFLDHRDKNEICKELGISRANLRILLHRAKRKIAQNVRRAHARDEVRIPASSGALRQTKINLRK